MSVPHAAVRLSTGTGGLEWPEVLALLAREARTPMGREEAQVATPLADPDAVRHALGETAQARAALGQTGAPPWEGVVDVRPMLEAARVPGSVAEAADLAALIPLLEAAGRLRAYGRAIAPVAPDLAAALTTFPSQKDLADLLARSIDADGQLRDDASPALRRLRWRSRDLRREIVKRLEAYFGAPGAEATFQERYVTVRHGRYVLPIRAEAKGRLRGIVHDRSQSGATLFVEPEGMVEANNDLVQAAREEETEILRILAALTDAVREALPDLDALVAGIGGLDLVFARGALAERMEAVEPAIVETPDVFLPGARNPLLLAQVWSAVAGRGAAEGEPSGSMAGRGAAEGEPSGSVAGRGAAEGEPSGSVAGRGAAEGEPSGSMMQVIPMDIEIHADRPLLVITGPNAGGKTVALKTLGLLALMAQAGCHVPARAGARLPVLPGLRHRGRRPERGREPLDLLRVRQAAPRRAGAGGRPLARAAGRAGRGHRPRRRSRAGPGRPRGARRARRGGGGLDASRAAQGLRLHPPAGPQRLGRVRPRAPRAHLPARLRPARPELRPVDRRAARPAARPHRARPRASLDPAAPAPGAARAPRRPRPAGRRAHRRARSPRGGERGPARAGPGRAGGGARHRAGRGGPGEGRSPAAGHRGAPARERRVGPPEARREEPPGARARAQAPGRDRAARGAGRGRGRAGGRGVGRRGARRSRRGLAPRSQGPGARGRRGDRHRAGRRGHREGADAGAHGGHPRHRRPRRGGARRWSHVLSPLDGDGTGREGRSSR